jgi:hypothetical protein
VRCEMVMVRWASMGQVQAGESPAVVWGPIITITVGAGPRAKMVVLHVACGGEHMDQPRANVGAGAPWAAAGNVDKVGFVHVQDKKPFTQPTRRRWRLAALLWLPRKPDGTHRLRARPTLPSPTPM